MAQTPVPRSFSQILGTMLSGFLADVGIASVRAGSPILSIFEAAAQSDFRSSQDIFQLLAAESLDNATGSGLDRIGESEGLSRLLESAASGVVDITDTSFSKIISDVYRGSAGPIVGSTAVKITDASQFPASGSISVGRGTTNYESPLIYSSKSNAGTYWVLTLSTPTTRYHNPGESVILAQGGDRTIPAGTIVATPQSSTSDSVKFSTRNQVTLPAGETQVFDVPVVCQKLGVIGNIAAGAINSFASTPFTGATVTNSNPYTNGRSRESDSNYRERIRAARRSKSLGTELAITTAINGIQAPDQQSRVISSSILTRTGLPSVLYIDDGTGYEEISTGVALETIIASALGGEQFFATAKRPITKAFVQTTISAPFSLIAGSILSVTVGPTNYEHTFEASSFLDILNATAFEVVASINANSALGFSARTSGSGSNVVLFAKNDTDEAIQVNNLDSNSGDIDANQFLGFNTGLVETMRLYKNDRLLQKDGRTAKVLARPFSLWAEFIGSQTLIVSVDKTPAVTYTFTDQDFIDLNTGFITVGKNSPAAWATVFQSKIPGITANVESGILTFTSNLGPNSRSQIDIQGGTLTTVGMWAVQKNTGLPSDYVLNRNLGQLELSSILTEGDTLTAGSKWTRAFLEADPLTNGVLTLSANANTWWSIDGSAKVIPSGVRATTSLDVTVSAVEPWGYKVKIASSGGDPLFSGLNSGDLAVMWDPAFPTGLQSVWEVANVGLTPNHFEIERKSMAVGHYAAGDAQDLGSAGVLVAGGYAGYGTQITGISEVLNTTNNSWSLTGAMITARAFHTLTKLNDGKVLAVGGVGSDGTILTAVEIYDPNTGVWSSVAALPAARWKHQSVKLNDRKVLVTGGISAGGTIVASAYIYNPSLNSWTTTTDMNVERVNHTLTLLPSGEVLAAGGQSLSGVSNTAELYSPSALLWLNVGTLNVARQGHRATLVSSPDRVFITGGGTNLIASAPAPLDSTEIYSIAGGTFSVGPTMDTAHQNHIQVKLDNNKVLVGFGNRTSGTAFIELFDAGTNTWVTKADPLGDFDRVLASAVKIGSSPNEKVVVAGGLTTGVEPVTIASSEVYLLNSNSWTQQDPDVGTVLPLNSGIQFVTSSQPLEHIVVPAGSNYTANSLVSNLNSQLIGATARTYKTTKLRVNTNSYATTGNIAVVAADVAGQTLDFTVADAVSSLTGHIASVESKGGDLGTPDFNLAEIIGIISTGPEVLTAGSPSVGSTLLTLKNIDRSTTVKRYGNNFGWHTPIEEITVDPSGYDFVQVENSPDYNWLPEDRLAFLSTIQLAPADTLSVLVDGDAVSKDFSVPFARKIQATTGVYGVTNFFTDVDASASLAATFGLNFNFNDFAVYMKARGLTHESTASKRILWRWYRWGAEGEFARVKYVCPTAPNKALNVVVDPFDNILTDVKVSLGGGAVKTGYTVRSTTKLGVNAQLISSRPTVTFLLGFSVSSATRIASGPTWQTTLTLTLPAGLTDHGFQVGDVLYLSSTDSNWISNPFTIDARTSTTVRFTDSVHGTGAVGPILNIGTVSFDLGPAFITGASPAIIVGDFFRVESSTGLPATVNEKTMRLSAVADQYWTGVLEGYSGAYGTGVDWYSISDLSGFNFWANLAQTATAIAAAVNALASATNSVCPVTATVTGTGSGQIDRPSIEDATDPTEPWVQLTDGINWIKSYVAPLSLSGDYEFTFKKLPSASLAANSDWANEILELIPVTVKNFVDWLKVLGVTGLSSVCNIEASSSGTKLQLASQTLGSLGSIQVESGTANLITGAIFGSPVTAGSSLVVTVPKTSADGFTGRSWVSVDNTIPASKTVFGTGTILDSWQVDGTMTFQSSTVSLFTTTGTATNVVALIEKQGNFVCIRDTIIGTSLDLGSEGDWVYISTPATPTVGIDSVSSVNTGVFRVVRVGESPSGVGKAFWIENSKVIPESTVEMDVKFFTPNSVMPGDILSISSDKWGVANKGQWTVQSVGGTTPFGSNLILNVSVTKKNPVPIVVSTPTLGTDAPLIQLIGGNPSRFIKYLTSISPNQNDPTFSDVKFSTSEGVQFIGENLGSVLTALDKFGFNNTTVNGIDGYAVTGGLIGEVNRVVYGVSDDQVAYPGVAAEGSQINIEGPLVRRIKMAFVLRVRSGFSLTEIAARARSAAAAIINDTGVGQPIALSDVIKAVAGVDGVISVVITQPAPTTGNDLIIIQPNEKPLVLDIVNDLAVSFQGE